MMYQPILFIIPSLNFAYALIRFFTTDDLLQLIIETII